MFTNAHALLGKVTKISSLSPAILRKAAFSLLNTLRNLLYDYIIFMYKVTLIELLSNIDTIANCKVLVRCRQASGKSEQLGEHWNVQQAALQTQEEPPGSHRTQIHSR